jgi:thymidine kinase
MKRLRVWSGPMCAAKTTGALQVARRYARQNMKVVLVRPASSKREHETKEGHLSTKDGKEFPSIDLARASQIEDTAQGADVVWIDEPAIFKDEEILPEVVARLRAKSIILISGLAATSELEVFGKAMPRLLAVADDVYWAAADCDICGTHGAATRSLYVGDTPKNGQVKVGGAESYVPACPACWTKKMAER